MTTYIPFSRYLQLSLADNKGPRRSIWHLKDYLGEGENKLGHVPYFHANLNIQGGADMHFNWNSENPPNYKILHFVRDPFEYVVSAYLYHAQQPPPPEKFVRQRHYNPCSFSRDKLGFLAIYYLIHYLMIQLTICYTYWFLQDIFVSELVLFGVNENELREHLNKTIDLCSQVHQHGPLHVELRHLAQHSPNEIKALQLVLILHLQL